MLKLRCPLVQLTAKNEYTTADEETTYQPNVNRFLVLSR